MVPLKVVPSGAAQVAGANVGGEIGAGEAMIK